MTNPEKAKLIRPWINPAERVTVDFQDEKNLNTEVTGCTDELVDLSIETRVPHMRQNLSLPLGQVEVSEDVTHYTRDPDRPLRQGRLMLVIADKRPTVVY